jgi:pimeloyl-ACP methyl ester carboxylesterase
MVSDDGVEIHYHVDDFRDPWISGPPETVLMSHGFARSMKWWTQWVPGLSRKYRVIRYDVRGCGLSSAPPEGATWSADRMARDAVNLMDHLNVDRVHWVGFESGGVWGMVFAAGYPGRVRSLTVINTPLFLGEKRGDRTVSRAIERDGLRAWLIKTNAQRFDPSLTDTKLSAWHLAEQSKTPDRVAAAIMRIVEDADLSETLPNIKAPTLIMVGDRAPGRPLAAQSEMQRRIPNARLMVFPGVGAGIHLLMPERCVQAVLGFLE